ncbi:hypothetical protein LBMAG56_27930 [Verrucomicrobiota bacterium]|nr:hypothetical protein LBMAG56_27930 [Verrucomicrobiota bacterium]
MPAPTERKQDIKLLLMDNLMPLLSAAARRVAASADPPGYSRACPDRSLPNRNLL